MKRVLLTIGVLFTSQSFAAAPVFCSSPTMAYQSGCTSTCAAIAAAGSFVMSNNSYAYCEGKLTEKSVDLRRVELGRSEIGNESRCIIWEGDDLQFDLAGLNGDFSSKYPITLDKCTVGTTYDALYVSVLKYEKITGESVFPDGTGKKMRTTSTFGAKDTGHDNTTANWLDSGPALDNSGFDDTSKYYTYPPGWSGWAYKKLGTKASDTDLSSASNEVMYWDEYKTSHSGNTDTTTRPGYNCSPSDSNECYASVSGQDDWYATSISSMVGLPVTLKEGDETLNLKWIKYSPIRGENQHKGLEVLWYKDALGVLKYAGIGSSSDGGYLEISNVRSSTTE